MRRGPFRTVPFFLSFPVHAAAFFLARHWPYGTSIPSGRQSQRGDPLISLDEPSFISYVMPVRVGSSIGVVQLAADRKQRPLRTGVIVDTSQPVAGYSRRKPKV